MVEKRNIQNLKKRDDMKEESFKVTDAEMTMEDSIMEDITSESTLVEQNEADILKYTLEYINSIVSYELFKKDFDNELKKSSVNKRHNFILTTNQKKLIALYRSIGVLNSLKDVNIEYENLLILILQKVEPDAKNT